MSPEKANIFFIEDDISFRSIHTRLLESQGHSVLLSAETLEEAVDKINLIKEKGINVVILDGNLNEEELSGADGAYLARLLKELHPEVLIVGCSSKEIIGVDANSFKHEGPRLLQVVKEL